ncbi:MAG: FRG domain-containing protein [Eubacteriales bacterium]|nr:FRG domain-containing protein [Eubacteriales bacterium]
MTKIELYRKMCEIVGTENARKYPKGFTGKCTVSNYVQFEKVIDLCNEYYRDQGLTVCYRGQSNYSWKIEPSISRDKSRYEKEISFLEPYINCSNLTIDTVFKAQHYGKPTRLLDVTMNSDVALWFASKKYDDIKGAVFIMPIANNEDLKANFIDYNLWQIENMNSLVNCSCQDQIDIQYKKQNKSLISTLDFNGLINIYQSSLKDIRIVNQQARGVLCEFRIYRQNNMKIMTYQKQFCFNIIKIEIASQSKKLILDKLKNLGIYEKFLFGNY